MWGPTSKSGTEPAPPALKGEVLTPGLPGKSQRLSFLNQIFDFIFSFFFSSQPIEHRSNVPKIINLSFN